MLTKTMVLRGKSRLLVLALILAIEFLVVQKSQALDLLDLQSHSTKSLSVSGATTAVAEDLSAFNLNPAGLSRFADMRLIGIDNRYVKQGRNWALTGGVIDGKTEDPLHWGFLVNTVHTKEIEEDQYTLGTSFNYENFLLFGATQRLTKFRQALLTRDGFYFSMNFGALAFLNDYISIGLAGRNLVRSKAMGTVMPARASAGIAGNFKFYRIDVDLERQLSAKHWLAKAGAEITATDTLILRGGYFHNFTREDRGYSLGTSVVIFNNANIDFGYLDQLNSSIITFSGGVSVKI